MVKFINDKKEVELSHIKDSHTKGIQIHIQRELIILRKNKTTTNKNKQSRLNNKIVNRNKMLN